MAFSLFPSELSESLKLVSWETVYLIGLFIVAVLIGIQAKVTLAHQGKTPKATLFALTGLLEGIWLLISGLALYYGDFISVIRAAPMAYIIYCVFGWGYGLYLLQGEAADIKNIDDIVMPDAYLVYCMAFSIVAALLSVVLLLGMIQFGYITFAQ